MTTFPTSYMCYRISAIVPPFFTFGQTFYELLISNRIQDNLEIFTEKASISCIIKVCILPQHKSLQQWRLRWGTSKLGEKARLHMWNALKSHREGSLLRSDLSADASVLPDGILGCCSALRMCFCLVLQKFLTSLSVRPERQLAILAHLLLASLQLISPLHGKTYMEDMTHLVLYHANLQVQHLLERIWTIHSHREH